MATHLLSYYKFPYSLFLFFPAIIIVPHTPESPHVLLTLEFTLVYFIFFFLSFFLSPPTLHLSCLAGEETGGAADFRPQERPIILLKHWGQRGGGREGLRREVRRGEERVGHTTGQHATDPPHLLTFTPLTASPLNVTSKMAP